KPECVYTCMTGAMKKNTETGFVEYDKNQCASCYMCIMACPYGVLKADAEKQKEIMKCDMCESTKSGNPQCVANCPMAAITLEEVED
ncbi:MAG: 4Fe-4S dicluster domain-containing protein, partial [Sarcina sp.]